MTRGNFWPVFAAGVAAGTLAGIGAGLIARRRAQLVGLPVLRLEKSINVGRPVDAVFSSLMNLEELPLSVGFIRKVKQRGDRSRWVVETDTGRMEWSARITQVVPNESLAWKSLRGPKHTGRVTVSPLEDQTVVHLVMNYAPRAGRHGALSPVSQALEQWIGRGLREFKAALEKDVRRAGSAAEEAGSVGGSLQELAERARRHRTKRRAAR